MKKFSFNLLVFVLLLLVSLCSSEHGGAPLRSGVAVAEDNGVHVKGGSSLRRAIATLKLPRALKKKQKAPKAANSNKVKVPKAAKSKRPKSVHACASIITQKDALLALKAGFTNGDTALADWVSTTDPCDDTWTGITCSGSDVTEIEVGK